MHIQISWSRKTCLAALTSLAASMFMASDLQAKEGQFHLFEIDEANLVYQKIIHNREFMLPDVKDEEWQEHVGLELKTSFLRFGYFDSFMGYNSARQKVTTVEWQIEGGIHAGDYLDLMWNHHSQHTADSLNSSQSTQKYPLFDAVGVRVHFLK